MFSFPELQKLCDINDIVFLQEHWLLPDELHLLNNIHFDFFSYGLSAVDISRYLLVGRPYVGTVILYRKNLADRLTVVHSSESRITRVLIDTVSGPILFINVYMPTNYGDDHSLEQLYMLTVYVNYKVLLLMLMLHMFSLQVILIVILILVSIMSCVTL